MSRFNLDIFDLFTKQEYDTPVTIRYKSGETMTLIFIFLGVGSGLMMAPLAINAGEIAKDTMEKLF